MAAWMPEDRPLSCLCVYSQGVIQPSQLPLSSLSHKQVNANLAAGLAYHCFWNVEIKMLDYQYF